MKQVLAVLCAIGVLAVPLAAQINKPMEVDASAQYKVTGPLSQRFWNLGVYSFSKADAQDEIAKAVDNGLYPTGIEVTGGDSLTITYARLLGIPAKDCYIKIIPDLAGINAGIQKEIIDKGFMPMDIALTSKGIFVLYIRTPVKIIEWRLFQVKGQDLTALQKEAQKYGDQGFGLIGLANYENNFWAFMLKTEKPLFAGTDIKGYKNDGESFIRGLEFQASSGSLPLGFMIAGDLVYCNFTRGK